MLFDVGVCAYHSLPVNMVAPWEGSTVFVAFEKRTVPAALIELSA